METNHFSISLENLLRKDDSEKAVLIVRLKGGEGREEIIKCESICQAKGIRLEMFATRQDISFALVMREAEFSLL